MQKIYHSVTLIRIIESLDKRDNCTLSGSTTPNYSNCFTSRYNDGKPSKYEHIRSRGVAEGDIFELYIAFHVIQCTPFSGVMSDTGFLLNNLHQFIPSSLSLAKGPKI